jgi:hypothetical protein
MMEKFVSSLMFRKLLADRVVIGKFMTLSSFPTCVCRVIYAISDLWDPPKAIMENSLLFVCCHGNLTHAWPII